MNYWLFKTEPHEFSIDALRRAKRARWDGIRNYQARNFLRDEVKLGDQIFIYHSSCKEVGVAGIAEVIKSAYADPTQFDPRNKYYDPKASTAIPRWFSVDVKFVEKFIRHVRLTEIKAHPLLQNMVLVKRGRLSVQPVEKNSWKIIRAMALGSKNSAKF